MSEDIATAPAELVKRGLDALFSGTREAEAFALLRTAAESGDPQGQYLTGMLYHLGKGGTVRDQAQADAWLARAAQQGHADAQYELAQRRSL